MAYRDDDDLEFLVNCSASDLSTLVEILITDKDGEVRYTEELTNTENYKRYSPDHTKYWQEIAAEIQCYDANTLASMFRGGKGILYRNVLTNACEQIEVSYLDSASTQEIEQNLLMKFLEGEIEQFSTPELKTLMDELDLNTADFTSSSTFALVQTSIRSSGIMAYKLALIVANNITKSLLAHDLSFADNRAYRVIIPSIIQVACLRAKINLHTYG